jgi:hypothetical protein
LDKKAIFFAENWEKSLKIVIITSTNGPHQDVQLRAHDVHLAILFMLAKLLDPEFDLKGVD